MSPYDDGLRSLRCEYRVSITSPAPCIDKSVLIRKNLILILILCLVAATSFEGVGFYCSRLC
jgi:hypothetical protein